MATLRHHVVFLVFLGAALVADGKKRSPKRKLQPTGTSKAPLIEDIVVHLNEKKIKQMTFGEHRPVIHLKTRDGNCITRKFSVFKGNNLKSQEWRFNVGARNMGRCLNQKAPGREVLKATLELDNSRGNHILSLSHLEIKFQDGPPVECRHQNKGPVLVDVSATLKCHRA